MSVRQAVQKENEREKFDDYRMILGWHGSSKIIAKFRHPELSHFKRGIE